MKDCVQQRPRGKPQKFFQWDPDITFRKIIWNLSHRQITWTHAYNNEINRKQIIINYPRFFKDQLRMFLSLEGTPSCVTYKSGNIMVWMDGYIFLNLILFLPQAQSPQPHPVSKKQEWAQHSLCPTQGRQCSVWATGSKKDPGESSISSPGRKVSGKADHGWVSQDSVAGLQHRATWQRFSSVSCFPAVFHWLSPPAPTLPSPPPPTGTAAPLIVSAPLRLAGKCENSLYLRTGRWRSYRKNNFKLCTK